jgi:E3 ubiquitin-protein ligase mind-bomb
LAFYGGKLNVAEKILDRIPYYDVNVTNSKGHTPLHLAVYPKCKMVLIKKILARTNSESVNAQDEDGNTALHYAIGIQSKAVVEELLKRDNVDVNLKNIDKLSTPLHVASVWKKIPVEMFRVFLEKTTNVNAQEKDGHTALHVAIRKGNRTAVEELLKRMDVDVNLKNYKNQTALHFATWWKNMPINLFKIILHKSSAVDAQDERGRTALHFAIREKNKTAVKVLLKRDDVDVNLKNNYNQTALHYACFWKNMPIDLFKVILEKSTHVNAQEEDGDTALHLAIMYKSATALKELLKRDDVNVNIKNNHSVTALQFASVWKNIPVDLFRVILTKLADIINAQDEDGFTALHYAIIGKNRTTVEELLKRDDVNENVNLKNNYNYTILHVASVWKNIPIDLFIKILEETTDVNAKDEDGNTALHWAIMSKSKIATNQLLNHNDVKVTIRNNKNQTALNLCSEWKGIPANLLKIINEKTTAENNAEAKNEAT